MFTFARLFIQAVAISLSNLRDHVIPTVALRAKIEQLRRERDVERRRGDTLDAQLTRVYFALQEAETRGDALLAELTEAQCVVNDTQHTIERVTTSNGHHMRENFELVTRLEFLEKRNAYLQAFYNHRREGLAGTLLVNRIARSARNMSVLDGVPAP